MSNALHESCDSCGRQESSDKGIFVHLFGGYAGYGSEHDGEFISLHFCSECLDRMLGKRPMNRNTGDS